MDQVDAVVVGAGVVGLAVGRALAQSGLEVLVLEATESIGSGISSRNSEVIHAGIYYPKDSLKARLCIEGNRQLYRFCEARGVPHRRCGKLIVATEPGQMEELAAIEQRALGNGVNSLSWLSGAEARLLEPQLRCEAALRSPSTGIIDSHAFMLSLQADLEGLGGQVVKHTAVRGARYAAGVWILWLQDGTQLRTDHLVNSAGLAAQSLALRFDGLDPALVPPAYFAKGNYFALNGRAPFSRLIYPVPVAAGLGVHFTLDLAGQGKFGPDVQWVDDPGNFAVAAERALAFYAEVRRYWPGLRDDTLAPSYSGIRPKIQSPQESAKDFVIQGPQEHGLKGLVNLFGIESPGLTSSLALADYVLRQLQDAA